MQIVIDIPEEVKHKVYNYGLSLGPNDKEQLVHAIANGTPLDDLRAEIEQTADEEQKYDERWAIGLRYAIRIIDKYKAESEDEG